MDAQTRMKILAPLLAIASSLCAQTADQKQSTVTAVVGESWLNHLHRSFDETSMGKTGRLGPAEESSGDAVNVMNARDKQAIRLHGADLYRWNCQGCHGESGLGAPPEINSVIDPVRASSAALVMQRMKRTGMQMSPAEAAKLARESQDAVVSRLHKGGQDMPAFSHLSEGEIHSLLAYLRQLADVPKAASQQIAIEEPAMRIGEHIVKSTCHVCHAASGPNPDAKQLADGAIPPLSTLTSRVSKERFIQKVTHGASIVMGSPELTLRGRMPVFYYLSEEEAADAYLYLTQYPPDQEVASEPVLASSAPAAAPSEPEPPQSTASPSVLAPAAEQKADDTSDMQAVAFLGVSLLLVLVLLGGMVAFTVWEVRRLSADQGTRAVKGQMASPARVHAARAVAGRLIA